MSMDAGVGASIATKVAVDEGEDAGTGREERQLNSSLPSASSPPAANSLDSAVMGTGASANVGADADAEVGEGMKGVRWGANEERSARVEADGDDGGGDGAVQKWEGATGNVS